MTAYILIVISILVFVIFPIIKKKTRFVAFFGNVRIWILGSLCLAATWYVNEFWVKYYEERARVKIHARDTFHDLIHNIQVAEMAFATGTKTLEDSLNYLNGLGNTYAALGDEIQMAMTEHNLSGVIPSHGTDSLQAIKETLDNDFNTLKRLKDAKDAHRLLTYSNSIAKRNEVKAQRAQIRMNDDIAFFEENIESSKISSIYLLIIGTFLLSLNQLAKSIKEDKHSKSSQPGKG